jgi:hypothetical protein
MKKIIVIVLIIIVILAALFFFLGKEEVKEEERGGSTFPIGETGIFSLPEERGGGFVEISPEEEVGFEDYVVETEGETASQSAVAGFTAFGETLRFVEGGTGHVFDGEEKVSNTTVPAVKEVVWGNLGQSLVLRYEEGPFTPIKSFLGRVAGGELGETGFLPDGISSLVAAPRGEEKTSCGNYLTKTIKKDGANDPQEVQKLQEFLGVTVSSLYDETTFRAVVDFQEEHSEEILRPVGLSQGNGYVGPGTRGKINELYCQKSGSRIGGGRLFYLLEGKGYLSDFESFSGDLVFSSLIKEWLLQWPTKKTLVLTTKPSSAVAGYAYLLTLGSGVKKDKDLVPLLEGKGLTLLASPDLERFVYAQNSGLTYTTHYYEEGLSRSFPVNTLPYDKCVWGKKTIVYCAVPQETLSGGLPDKWYKGQISLTDDIFAIDTETDTVTLLLSSEEIDVINPLLSEDESKLYFQNKRDGYLWEIALP